MLITEQELQIPNLAERDPFEAISRHLELALGPEQIPIRFVVTDSNADRWKCELGVISDGQAGKESQINSIFGFDRRPYETANKFNVALLIPTGIGCELGGHSGDAGALARLFAQVADNLITHPNVVNAADINELPENGLYVEGSIITRLLMGTISLQKVRSNRVLLVIDEHSDEMFHELAVNSASAARASLGLNCPLVVRMQTPTILRALFSASGRAVGRIEHFENICQVIEEHRDQFDALALSTLINVPTRFHADYFKEELTDMVNPWGGVEAMLTHSISSLYKIPSAHSPMMTSNEIMNLNVGVVDPRKAAEAVSTTYLHCVLKGLQRAPRIVTGQHPDLISARNISCLVIPDGCLGLPVLAAMAQGIPVIAVEDRHCRMKNSLEALPFEPGKLLFASNYLEALGIATSLKAGVALETVRRPINHTRVQVQKKRLLEVGASDFAESPDNCAI